MEKLPSRVVGIDLTDTYSNRPRPVDVAILDTQTGTVTFRQFTYPTVGPTWAEDLTKRVRSVVEPDAVVVIDGPQALAAPHGQMRHVERILRTPGQTGWQLPTPRSRPFAGYVRTSVEC